MSFAIITTLVIMKRTAPDHFTNDLLSFEERKSFFLQHQNDISAEEFAQNLNFLCILQGPEKTGTGYPDHGRLNDANDIEDFLEVDTDLEEEELEALPGINLKRKRISLCRHKLQG
jgi:hypothetical protein